MSVGVLVEHFGGDVESGVCRWDSSVDGQLQQDLPQVARFELVREAGANVQAEFLPSSERGGRRQHEQAARAAVEPRARPESFPTGRT